VEFSEKEKNVIIHYGNIILNEAEKIEHEKDHVIFYFDIIEPLIKRISDNSLITFSKTELLTVLEILQIASYYEDFPTNMENTISSLISFFQE
jgi:regulator of RNase E activity RraB